MRGSGLGSLPRWWRSRAPVRRRPASAQAPQKPNIVVLMSDDQTAASQSVMAKTNELVGGAGATFTNSFTNWPLCCPSRATFLTGQYAHNHAVLGNQPPFGGFDRLDTSETLPVWLQRVGLLHGPDRQVPQRLRGLDGRRAARLVGVARDEAHLHLLRRAAAARTARSSPTGRPTRIPTTRRIPTRTRPTCSRARRST